jgi:hypothetical protein
MIDSMTRERMIVSSDDTAGPYISVPVDQLDVVEAVLQQNHITYWVDSGAIALNGKPEVTVINLGRRNDASQIQRLLDAA